MDQQTKTYRIGDLAQRLGLSVDALRYYEKIGLMPRVPRSLSGMREYDARAVSRLRFIQRAQKMGFSLAEIGDLLSLRENPQQARDDVRQLTADKLSEIELRLEELGMLRDELRLLLNLCRGAKDGCPIMASLDQPDSPPSR